MSNIQQVFRVSLRLADSPTEDFEGFYDRVENEFTWTGIKHILKHSDLEWDICTWGNTLTCLKDFDKIEDAEAAEVLAFDILAEYGYWKEEEE